MAPRYWPLAGIAQEKRQQEVRGSEDSAVRRLILLASSRPGLHGLAVFPLPKATALAGLPSLRAMTILSGFQ